MSSNQSRPSSPSSVINELQNLSVQSISSVPETSLENIRNFFCGMSDSAILRYGLGLPNASAPALAENTVVIVMDCEKHEHEPRVLTEYGLHTFTRKEMAPIFQNPGAHGEEILRNIYYYHIRLLENAHYTNRKFCPGNPEKNHFGSTRFATKQQAKDFLTNAIAWPVEEGAPESGDKCPVIFLGHAVKNELQMLQDDLGVDPSVLSNVVAIIDTQTIAAEQGYRGRGDKIGLGPLMEQCGVEFKDGHTASNDAAYTVIGALHMVMKDRLPLGNERSLQDVVDDLGSYSAGVAPDVGVKKYCTRCASFQHNRPQCRGKIERCEKCLKAGHEKAAYTHVTKLCSH
ncbi:hypothetical protein TW65_05209 [Stemphylium lycopersici]|uniref:Gfd2/YDR514C-like C-terminal domain-containing protein n=1 Tax=Stemphylium lycopersici TaxID=183478 RepID=A0A364MU37_STELY|nr:hypothetical protein TW65_05209 [Stemphylium lycopersici]RAR03522.1 hypothetical protein DDE83_008190 [Stemphylium lycopersici]